MKLNTKYNGQENEIEFNFEGTRLNAEIGGRAYELEVSRPEPDLYLFKFNNMVYQVLVSPQRGSAERSDVLVGTDEFSIEIFDPKKLRATNSENKSVDGIAEIKTAMPGKVVRILVDVNSEIQMGEGVIIVEAMKMQNEIKSPKDGIVKEIRFGEGETVSAGDTLVVIS